MSESPLIPGSVPVPQPIRPANHGGFGQLDPTSGDYAYYQILDPNNNNHCLAEIIATNTAGNGFERGVEYWRIHPDQTHPQELQTSSYLQLDIQKSRRRWSDAPPFQANEASYVRAVNVQWSTAKNNGGWTGVQVEDPARYGLYVSVSYKDGKWAGFTTFLSTGGNLFADPQLDDNTPQHTYSLRRETNRLTLGSYYWFRDDQMMSFVRI